MAPPKKPKPKPAPVPKPKPKPDSDPGHIIPRTPARPGRPW